MAKKDKDLAVDDLGLPTGDKDSKDKEPKIEDKEKFKEKYVK